MADGNNGLQDLFLNNLRKTKTPVTMFLVKGVKLQGIITWFDNFSVLLRRDGHTQLVYKHAISTVMPSGPVQLFEPDKEEEAAAQAAVAAEQKRVVYSTDEDGGEKLQVCFDADYANEIAYLKKKVDTFLIN